MMRNRLVALLLITLISACNAYGPKPTPAQSPTPKPTVVPSATVGPLTNVAVDKLRMTLLAPSSWTAPVALNDNSIILSPDGSTDTSSTAGPFLLIMLGDSKFFHSKLSFPQGIIDPVQQLDAMIKALNYDAPEISPIKPYDAGKYPGAIVRLFERGLERTIVLLKADSEHWLYIGAQSQEKYFAYYETAFFKPAADSIMVKLP